MYTRDEIMSMSAGRELDAMVAEHVMGWELRQVGNGSMDGEYYWHDGCDFVDGRLANLEFSTDIAAAWEVVEKPEIMDKYQIGVYPTSFGKWVTRSFMAGYNITVQEDSAPLAICKVALLTLIKEG